MSVVIIVIVVAVALFVVMSALLSIQVIGPTQVGLVQKRFSFRKLPDDNPVAFHGEAGYQATLLTPGLRFKLWPMYAVKKFPWVQVPAGEIGVVDRPGRRAARRSARRARCTRPSSRTSPI